MRHLRLVPPVGQPTQLSDRISRRYDPTPDHDHLVAVMRARGWHQVAGGLRCTLLGRGDARTPVQHDLRRDTWDWRATVINLAGGEGVPFSELDAALARSDPSPAAIDAARKLLEDAGWTLIAPGPDLV